MSKRTRHRLAASAALVVVAVVAATLWLRRGALATPKIGERTGPARLESAVLPERCALQIGVALPKVLSQPSFASQPANMVLSSALGRTPEAHEIVERLIGATESQSLNDLIAIHVCRERMDGGFVASIQGRFKKGALAFLTEQKPDKWKRVSIKGVEAVTASSRHRPFYAQTEDGSILVAGSEESFERAVDRANAGAAPPKLAEDAGLWAALSFEPALGAPVKGSQVAWEHARRLELTANFEQRAFNALLEVDHAASAEPMAKQLRLLAAMSLSRPKDDSHDTNAFTYLVQRARISTRSNVVVVDSELSGDALQWLSSELAKRARSRSDPT